MNRTLRISGTNQNKVRLSPKDGHYGWNLHIVGLSPPLSLSCFSPDPKTPTSTRQSLISEKSGGTPPYHSSPRASVSQPSPRPSPCVWDAVLLSCPPQLEPLSFPVFPSFPLFNPNNASVISTTLCRLFPRTQAKDREREKLRLQVTMKQLGMFMRFILVFCILYVDM